VTAEAAARALRRDITPHELDPTARTTSFYFTIALGAVSVGAAIGLTVNDSGVRQLSLPWLGILAIAVLAVAYAALIVMTKPSGPLLSRFRFQAIFALVILANVLSAVGQFGSNDLARDDWGPICLGLALLACAPFRPAHEILWLTVQAVITAGTLAVVQSLTSEVTVPGVIVVVVAITPSVGIGLGGAAYSRSLVDGLLTVRAAEAEERRRHDDELRQRILDEDSVGQLGALRSEVVPFFELLSAQGFMTEGDSRRAIDLSAGLRLAIVERLSSDSLSELVADFSDFGQVSRSLTERQRAALRALIGAIREAEGVEAGSLSLTLSREQDRARGSLTFRGGDSRALRAGLNPFVRMLGFVVGAARFSSVAGKSAVRFTFDAG
jgi:hypothetical protein